MATASFTGDRRWAEYRYYGRAETHRRVVVKLVFVIYLLALIEGPLRKWILPGYAAPLYFLRDPFVLVLYAYCLQYRLLVSGRMGGIWVGFAYFATVASFIPFTLDNLNPLGLVLGARTYWIYVPLAFVVAGNFRREDVERFLRWNMVLAVPCAALVIHQYNAPPNAWVNLGIAGSEGAAVILAFDTVRPFGLFTYTSQNVDFTASMVAMFLAYLMLRDRRRIGWPLFIASALAICSMAILTGSRSIYFFVAAIVVVTLAGQSMPKGHAMRYSIAIAAFIAFGGLLLVKLFPDMYAAMQVRFEQAAQAEGSIWSRAFGGVGASFEALWSAPLFGYGMGTGTPSIANFLGKPPLIYGESELDRNVNELGPLLGLFFVMLRFATAVWLVLIAMGAVRRGERAALPLAGYAMIPLAMGQITHSPLTAFQPWLVAGLVLALCADCRQRPMLRGGAVIPPAR